MSPHDRSARNSPNGGYFPTTHWSVVMNAGILERESAGAALEQLCQTYWYPLYAYLRRKGCSEADAQDHVQSFFAQLFERDSLQSVSSAKGKFRSFLLASLNYYLADHKDRARAQKRGGGQLPISLDAAGAEERYKLEPVEMNSPDILYERRWALTVLEHVLTRLECEFRENNNHALFLALQPYLVRDGASGTLASVAAQLNKTEEAVKKSVQRMRGRYYDIFREEILQTLESPDELEEEIHYLCRVIAET